MRAKVSSESEDDSISMLTQFHPAWRKMVPMCYRLPLISQVIINLLGLLLYINDENAEYSTYSHNAARLPLTAQRRLGHYCELHVIQKAALTHLIVLVFHHILSR